MSRISQQFLIALCCLALPSFAADTAGTLPAGVSVERIWDEAPHSAFTDLVEWRDRYYCTFRESTDHVHGEDGKIRVIVSEDGDEWESLARFEREGIDLRDPKLSITPDDRLMILCGGSRYEGRELVGRAPMVAFLADPDGKFSQPSDIVIDAAIASRNDWLWRVTWHEGVGYGVVYQANRETNQWSVQLVRTVDGINYTHLQTLDLEGKPNESTVRFAPNDTMYIVVRNEDGKPRGHLGASTAPYTDWAWSEIPTRLGGPDFIFIDDNRMVLGTREYGASAKMMLGTLAPDGSFSKTLTLPSGGDTSYPRLMIQGDQLWVSYYASHEEKTAIYIARMPLALFE